MLNGIVMNHKVLFMMKKLFNKNLKNITLIKKNRKELGLPCEQVYFYHHAHTSKQRHYEKPSKENINTMFRKGFDYILPIFKQKGFSIDNLLSLNATQKDQLLHDMTDIFELNMVSSSKNGSHETFKGPFLLPCEEMWRYINGDNLQLVMDCYIRLNIMTNVIKG